MKRGHIKKSISLVLGILILVVVLVLFIPGRTSSFSDNNGKIIENSIAKLQKVEIGEVEQYLLIRGKSTDNPILLFVHGGPGYAQISYAPKFQKELENDFVVVNWDQRGSGKSYTWNMDEENMTKEQFISDTKDVIDYLCNELGKEKVYLVGHSWGSVIGLEIAKNYPEKVLAYISIGQTVDKQRAEMISYEYVMEMAIKENNTKAINELKEIGEPPYDNVVHDISVQRKWLSHYGGVERKVNTIREIIYSSIFSPEYTGIDGVKFLLGSNFSAKTMWSSTEDVNFMNEINEISVPVYFCIGKYDYNTPFVLVEEYYEYIQAPKKELIWFNQSAHFPQFEEPDKFHKILLDILKES